MHLATNFTNFTNCDTTNATMTGVRPTCSAALCEPRPRQKKPGGGAEGCGSSRMPRFPTKSSTYRHAGRRSALFAARLMPKGPPRGGADTKERWRRAWGGGLVERVEQACIAHRAADLLNRQLLRRVTLRPSTCQSRDSLEPPGLQIVCRNC